MFLNQPTGIVLKSDHKTQKKIMSEGENTQDCNTDQGIQAYHHIFQYFLSKRVNDHDWIHLATNGKWPVNTSQITARETAEILTMILVEFGGTLMTTAASTSRKIRRFTHADKACKGKSAELCDFRHLYALSLVDFIVGQMTDIFSNAKKFELALPTPIIYCII